MNYWERGVINQLQLPFHLPHPPPKKQKKRSFYLILFSFLLGLQAFRDSFNNHTFLINKRTSHTDSHWIEEEEGGMGRSKAWLNVTRQDSLQSEEDKTLGSDSALDFIYKVNRSGLGCVISPLLSQRLSDKERLV